MSKKEGKKEEIKKDKNVKEETSSKKKKNNSKKEDRKVVEKKENVSKEIKKNDKKQKEEKEAKKENTTELKKVEETKKERKPISEKVVIFSIIAAILVVAFGIFGYYFYATNMIPVATYDGGKVTKSEFAIYYKTFQPMLTYYGYSDDIIPQQIANKAALDKIIIKEAKKEGVTIPDDRKKEIDEQFQDKNQIKQLEEQGINANQMKQLYYDDAMISAYIDKKVQDLSDEDVLNYIKSNSTNSENLDLNSYETNHVLFKTTSDSGTALSNEEKANKKAQAEAVLQRVKNGEDIATIAKDLSEDTGTKDNGGSYTVYMDGQTDDKYASAVKSMQVGDVVLVESSYGYHVIKLASITENGRAKSEYDRENLVNENINKISTDRNFKVNEDNLKKAVKQISGKSSTDSDNTTTNNTTTNNTTTSTTTNSTDSSKSSTSTGE